MTPNLTPTRRHVYVLPATIRLIEAGSSVGELAHVLGVVPSCVSHYLAGRRRLPAHMPTVLAELIGPSAAKRVLAAIPSPDKAGPAA